MERYWNSPLGLTAKNPREWIGSERQPMIHNEQWVCVDCKLHVISPGTALCDACVTRIANGLYMSYFRQDVSEFRDLGKGG